MWRFHLRSAGTTGWRSRLRRATTPPSAEGRTTATLAHTCLTTPPPHTPLTPRVRPPQRPGRAARGRGRRTTARGARRTAAAPPLLWDATKRGRALRSSWCSDHTHSWSTARTTTRPGETGVTSPTVTLIQTETFPSVPSCYFSSKCFFSAGSWRRQPTPPWTICPSTSLCASLWRKDRPMERLRTEEERREEEKLREEQEVEKDPVWTASVRNSTPSTSWREEDSSLWVWKPSRVNRYNVFEPGCCDQLHH